MSFSTLTEQERAARQARHERRRATRQLLHDHADHLYQACYDKAPGWEAVVRTQLALMKALVRPPTKHPDCGGFD